MPMTPNEFIVKSKEISATITNQRDGFSAESDAVTALEMIKALADLMTAAAEAALEEENA